MIVNFTSNLNSYQNTFTSRKKEIREADKMVLLINRAYPRISCSNIQDFSNIDKYPKVYDRAAKLITEMRCMLDAKTLFAKEPISKLKAFKDVVLKYKAGNCDESAKLAYIAAKVNGLKDIQLASIETLHDGPPGQVWLESQDHMVLRVENGNKPYVIDPWLGFADYVPQAIQKYKNEFGYHFDFNSNPDDIVLVHSRDTNFDLLLRKVSQEDMRKTFPELIIPKPQKQGVGSKIKKLFKNLSIFINNVLQR